jgi:hypothetical protein
MKRISYSQFMGMKKDEKLAQVPCELEVPLDDGTTKVLVVGNVEDVVFTTGFHYEIKYKIKCLVDLARASMGRI